MAQKTQKTQWFIQDGNHVFEVNGKDAHRIGMVNPGRGKPPTFLFSKSEKITEEEAMKHKNGTKPAKKSAGGRKARKMGAKPSKKVIDLINKSSDLNPLSKGTIDILHQEYSSSYTQRNEEEDYNIRRLTGIKDLTQSESIKLGHMIENVFNIVSKKSIYNVSSTIKNILTKDEYSPKQSKNRQLDLLIERPKDFMFREIKSNGNLDSEKWPATLEKIREVEKAVAKKFSKPCFGAVVVPWWDYEAGMPAVYKTEKITFAKDYFISIGVEMTKEMWYTLIKDVAEDFVYNIRKE